MFYEMAKETPLWITILSSIFIIAGFSGCDAHASTWRHYEDDGFKSIYITLPLTLMWIIYAIIVKYVI